MYLIATSPPCGPLVLTGLEMKVEAVDRLGHGSLPFTQKDDQLHIKDTGPVLQPGDLPRVFRFRCDRPPALYKTGGMRTPKGEHPRYDPLPPDIAW